MVRPTRRIVISDDEEDESNKSNDSIDQQSEEQRTSTGRSSTAREPDDPFTPSKREKRKKTRHSKEDKTLTEEVSQLEISRRSKAELPKPPVFKDPPSKEINEVSHVKRNSEVSRSTRSSFAVPATPILKSHSLPFPKPTMEYEESADATEFTIPVTPAGRAGNETFNLSTPMVTSTPVRSLNNEQGIQVAHLEPLPSNSILPEVKENIVPSTPLKSVHMPPPNVKLSMTDAILSTPMHMPPPGQALGNITSSQYSNEGLVTVSPSKGRLRSIAAEQASSAKEATTKPRLVISKLVLTNFKSYAGRQEIGPFHSVS